MKPACLIVGAGPGIGQSVALAFAREGHDIALASRNPGKLDELCRELRKLGATARAYAADAADEASLRGLFAAVRKDFSELDVVVYNAAAHGPGKPTTLDGARLAADFQVNVTGALICAQEAAVTMKPRGHGTVLLTGGGFAHEPAASYASLSLGKAALRNLTYSLAQELGAHGIHVATVTVYGFVQSGTQYDPARIADAFVRLHRQAAGHFQTELVFK
ncbi:MAG: SDR family NAD(P)-dependent oxidoreductase [Gammaproteobacteria bacterium]